jgi:hypothetical protein
MIVKVFFGTEVTIQALPALKEVPWWKQQAAMQPKKPSK